METAQHILAKRGGIRPVARALGHRNPTTVQGWWQRNSIPMGWVEKVRAIPETKGEEK